MTRPMGYNKFIGNKLVFVLRRFGWVEAAATFCDNIDRLLKKLKETFLSVCVSTKEIDRVNKIK